MYIIEAYKPGTGSRFLNGYGFSSRLKAETFLPELKRIYSETDGINILDIDMIYKFNILCFQIF